MSYQLALEQQRDQRHTSLTAAQPGRMSSLVFIANAINRIAQIVDPSPQDELRLRLLIMRYSELR
jgi:hypothetical protein